MIIRLRVSTRSHTDFVDITNDVNTVIARSQIAEGVALVYVPHTTAGITINEHADPTVAQDLIRALDRAVPWAADYQHLEGNAAAHIKASLMGSSVSVVIENGRLLLGTWQGVFFCEFDGPRERTVIVKLLRSS